MEDPNFINLFINEEIYLIDSDYHEPEESKAAKSQVLVITPEPLSEVDQTYLFKIFASVNVEPEQLELSKDQYQLEDYSMAFFFGSSPEGIQTKLYQKTSVDRRTLVVGHSLAEIAIDNDKKRQLWEVLQSCFT